MKRNTCFFALFLTLIFCGCAALETPSSGVTVYFNGKIYTAEKENPSATAFAIQNGKFIAVGDDRSIQEKYGNGIDLKGRRVIPGMIDSHCHPVFTSSLLAFDLIAVGENLDLRETLALLKEKAADPEHKDLPVIFGIGFGTKCRPIRAVDLDRAIPDRPAIIFSSDGHAYWLNTKAMELGKLDRNTVDPVPGASYFERDAAGNLTGYILETTAGFAALRKMGVIKPEHVRSGLGDVQKIFARNGITAAFEAGFLAVPEETGLAALRGMEEDGELSMRFFTSYVYFGSALDSPENMLNIMKKHRAEHASSDLLRADTLKLIADGTLEVQTAWMAENYLPPAKGRGAPTLTMTEMLTAARPAAAEGFNIHNHAIGDATISMTLDFYKKLGAIKGTKTICHVQILPGNGIQRFIEQKDDVFYQTTPCWLMDDLFTRQVLGMERYLRQVPLASLIRGGVTVTFGSDFPVSGGELGVNPFTNMWVAVNRAALDKIAPPKSEAITVENCVDAYTINGARQIGAADRIGSIRAGKSADFVLCSEDIFTVDPLKLNEIKVHETYFRGKRIHPEVMK